MDAGLIGVLVIVAVGLFFATWFAFQAYREWMDARWLKRLRAEKEERDRFMQSVDAVAKTDRAAYEGRTMAPPIVLGRPSVAKTDRAAYEAARNVSESERRAAELELAKKSRGYQAAPPLPKGPYAPVTSPHATSVLAQRAHEDELGRAARLGLPPREDFEAVLRERRERREKIARSSSYGREEERRSSDDDSGISTAVAVALVESAFDSGSSDSGSSSPDSGGSDYSGDGGDFGGGGSSGEF